MTLEGIEILHQTMIMEEPSWLLLAIMLGGAAIFSAVGALLNWLCDEEFAGLAGGFLCLGLYILLMMAAFDNSVPTGRYRYEAIIDESVNFTELYEQYDVVEQRGEIYILEDKETKNNE